MTALASWKSETRAVLKEYAYACDDTQVFVDQIIRNETISGHITGLPAEAYDKFKMVFYVKTNHWYVHPFEGDTEGSSFANLNVNGEFKIKTVLRQVASKRLAAVLVPRSYKVVSQRWFLKPFLGIFGGILKYECAHKLVDGNGDFFTN